MALRPPPQRLLITDGRAKASSSQSVKTKRKRKALQIRSSYRYEPLDLSKNEIRLLELAPGTWDSPIAGRLFAVSLDDNPDFDALSYLWGDPTPIFPVIFGNQREIRIARNLRNALRDIRSEERAMVIWADAICICQGKNDERGHQVQLMRQIYSKARTVRSWIDVEVDPNSRPFKELAKLAPGEASLNLSKHPASFWYPVAEIFRSPYWHRLWIQQELILARDISIHCRRHQFSGESILKFQEDVDRLSYPSLAQCSTASELWTYCGGKPAFLDGILRAREICRRLRPRNGDVDSESGQPNWTMLDMFFNSRSLGTSEPHDRVFGLLGIMGDIDPNTLSVDYNLPLVEVYAQILESFLKTYHSLMFLCVDLEDHEDSDVPSWLPSPQKGPWLLKPDVEASCASGKISALRAHIHSNGRALTVRGHMATRITYIGKKRPLNKTPISTWKKSFKELFFRLWPAQEPGPLWLNERILDLFFPPWKDTEYRQIIHRGAFQPWEKRKAMEDFLKICGSVKFSKISLGDIYHGRKSLAVDKPAARSTYVSSPKVYHPPTSHYFSNPYDPPSYSRYSNLSNSPCYSRSPRSYASQPGGYSKTGGFTTLGRHSKHEDPPPYGEYLKSPAPLYYHPYPKSYNPSYYTAARNYYSSIPFATPKSYATPDDVPLYYDGISEERIETRKARREAKRRAELLERVEEAITIMYLALLHRMFIATESKLIGLVDLCDVRQGDEIWILFGCPMPVVLRPRSEGQEGGYTWIAAAYIPGLMNGEACKGIRAKNGKPRKNYRGSTIQDITLW